MEGETILTGLKDGGKMDFLSNEIERFYLPVSRSNSKLTASVANKYGVFAMKALRGCIQRLTETKPGSQDLPGILQISEKSYQCVNKARKHIKTVPLALEKLLFHTMAQAINKRLLSDAQRIASFLYDELSKSRSQFLTDSGVDNEYDTIVKQAFNQLWKACLELEQSSQAQYALKHVLILNVRLQALHFLMLTDYECSWVVERALRAAVDFDRKSSKSGGDQDQLHVFLTTVLDLLITKGPKVAKSKEGDSGKQIASMFELGIQAIKYSVRASKYEQALEICKQLSDFTGSKGHIKEGGVHSQCLVLIKSALQYKHHTSNKSKPKSKSATSEIDSIADTIQSVTSNISKIAEKTTLSSANLSCILEACEILKKSLEGGSDTQQKPTAAQIPEVMHEPVYDIMMLYVGLLQMQKEQLLTTVKENRQDAKSQNQQVQRNVNRQLGTLDFLSTMTLEIIKSFNQDADDKDLEGYLAKAVKICNRTKDVIEDVASGGGGSLSTEENRWFGSNAYNVGLVCYRRKCYTQSSVLLEIACHQLQKWCYTGDKLDMDKVKKVQLLTRYELLIDSQRKAGQHLQAMTSVVKCLWDVCGHMTDHVTSCIELWVKAKRDALKEEASDEIQSRTLLDAIKESEGKVDDDHRDFVSMLLKKELQAYKAARHDTTVEQHSVVCDLLNLNSSDDTKLAYCHALVEQAQLMRIRNFESDKSASECCSEAIDILSELVEESSASNDSSDNPQSLLAFDILATAYFWMYVCQMEEIQLSGANPTASSPESDTKHTRSEGGIVPHIAYTLGMEHANMQYLDMALGIWADLLCNGFKPDVFHDLSVSSQCLKLMASLYDLSEKPLQLLQSLHLLSVISTATGNISQSVYAFCQLSSTLCYIGETKLAGHILRKAEDVIEKADTGSDIGGGGSSRNLELTCMMAKAEYLLYNGQFDSFQSKLGKLLQSQASERRTYNTYLQNANIKHLQATCMDTNPEFMTPDLCPERLTALELAVEAMRTRMGVCSNLLGEYFCSSRQEKDGGKAAYTSMMETNTQDEWYDQWSILSAVLQSLLQVGKLYCQQGCVREAECYLHEGLVIANQYLLPRRCAEFSIQLSKVYTMKGHQCQAQLTQMKQFVDINKDTKALHMTKGTSKITKKGPRRISSKASLADNSDDEDFIQSKRLSLTDILSGDNAVSSPTLKSQTVKLPEYHKHDSACGCESCIDVVLHRLDFEYLLAQARSSTMEGDLLEALSEVDTAKKFSVWAASHDDRLMQASLKSLTDSDEKTSKASSKKNKNSQIGKISISTAQFHDQTVLGLHLLKAQILLQQNKPQRVQQCIDEGLAMFAKDTSPVILPPGLKAELQFYQIIANVSQQGCDMFASAWHSAQNQVIEASVDVDGLSSRVGKLDLNQESGARSKSVSHKHNVGWVDTVKHVGRPELARRDLVTPAAQMYTVSSGGIGIFCDGSDGEDDNIRGASAITKTPKASRPKTALHTSTKKGVFSYSVKKKTKTSKKIPEKGLIFAKKSSQEPMSAFSLDNDVFDFDSPTVGTKKGKSTKKTKSAKSVTTKTVKSRQKTESRVTFADSDHESLDAEAKDDAKQINIKEASVFSLDDENFDSEKDAGSLDVKSKSSRKTSKSKERFDDGEEECSGKIATSKRSTASKSKKKPVFELSESDADQDVKPELPKGRRKQSAKKQAQDDEQEWEPDVKPKSRGRGRKKVDEPSLVEVEESVEQKPVRQRRGRKANIENARAEDDELVFDSFKMVMEATSILPIDTPEDISDTSAHGYSDLDLSCDATKDTCNTSVSDASSQIEVTIGSAVSDMLLEDIDEIEIPRAGSDSEEEDVACGKKKKMMAKKASSRRRGTKKTKDVDDEEDGVEMLRASSQVAEDVSSKQQKKRTGASSKQIQGTLSASDLTPVVEQLEQIYNITKCSAPLVLYRQICHMLALCYGDQNSDKAVHYLNEAMAVTLRHKKVSSLTKKIKKIKKASSDVDQLSNNLSKMALIPDNDRRKKKSSSKQQTSLSELDVLEEGRKMFIFHDVPSLDCGSSIVQETVDVLPDGWTVCSLSVVSAGVNSSKVPSNSDFLVVSRLAKNKETILHKIPLCKNDFGFSKSFHDILEEFDAIMLENKESVKETDKKIWWSCRQKLDERMETLTKDMESLFGCWKGIMLGQRRDSKYRKQLEEGAKEFKTAVKASCQTSIDQHLCECLLASASQLSNQELNSAISCVTSLKSGSEEHTGLTTIFRQQAAKLPKAVENNETKHPVILVLDKQIQQLPWENMLLVRGQPICRMPSLHFIASHLKTSQVTESVLSKGVDTSDTFFVLNPTNDLANTQKTFQKWFEKDNGWEGVVARAPTKEEYMAALTDHNLFVYCGHGNGQEFLTGDDIQKLSCRAATLLIGCSSGKLHVNGSLEAYGMALNYLLSECPCVVANLWDVTDRDVDRFLEDLLKAWLASDKTTSLPDFISEARHACKLQYLIGCSPVVYGLPVQVKK